MKSDSRFFHRWRHANVVVGPMDQVLRREAAVNPWWIGLEPWPRNLLSQHKRRIWLVQLVSLFRIVAILCFASMVFAGVPKQLLFSLYCFALVSDLLDGYLARKLQAVTYFGRVMDLVADKSLTMVSLLYAAERGVNLLPLAVIATRDVITLGMRLIRVEGKQILPTNRIFGGLMATILGANTLVLLCTAVPGVKLANAIYWICAGVFTLNLVGRFYVAAPHMAKVLIDDGS